MNVGAVQLLDPIHSEDPLFSETITRGQVIQGPAMSTVGPITSNTAWRGRWSGKIVERWES